MLGIITGIFFIIFSIGASQAVNIGGGPLIILLIMFSINFPIVFILLGIIKMLMPLLYIILMSSSLITTVKNYKQKNIATNKYVIDYEIIVLVLPVLASGAFFGVLCRNLLSEMLLITLEVFYMLYLIYCACKSQYYRGFFTNANFQMYNNNINQNHTNDETGLELKLLPVQNNQIGPYIITNLPNPHKNPNNKQQQDFNPQLQKILEQQQNRFPKAKLKIVGIIFLYSVILFMIKNSTQTDLVVVNPGMDIPEDFINGTQYVYPVQVKEADRHRVGVDYIEDGNSQRILLTSTTSCHMYKQFELTQQEETNIQILKNQIHSPSSSILPLQILAQPTQTGYNPFEYSLGLKSCLFGSIVCFAIHLTLSYLSSKSFAIQTVSKQAQKQKYGYVYVKESDKMSSKKMWNCMISGFFGGVSVGLLGVGSSVTLVPTWINQGVQQQTANSSASPLTLFASIICIILSAFQGLYHPYYTIALITIFIISGISTIFIYFLFSKMNNDSYNFSHSFMKKIKLILWISTIIALVLYYILQSTLNKYFTDFGAFC